MIFLFIFIALCINAFIGSLLEEWIKDAFLEQGQMFTETEKRFLKHLWVLYLIPVYSYRKSA